jgi:hypothetical protein
VIPKGVCVPAGMLPIITEFVVQSITLTVFEPEVGFIIQLNTIYPTRRFDIGMLIVSYRVNRVAIAHQANKLEQ